MSGLKLHGVSFSYGDKPALNDVSWSVPPGSLTGLLGPNGAGKTTLVTLIAGLLQPAAGTVQVAGYCMRTEAVKARSRLGLVFQSISLDRFMRVDENLRFAAGLQGLDTQQATRQIDRLLQILPLAALMQRSVHTLSGGQQRLVDIARALVHAPAVLVLDEPTHGLDVVARQQVWTVLESLRSAPDGPAVLVSTHLMDEAAGCDEVGFLKAGSLLWTGTPAQALEQLPVRSDPQPRAPARSLADWFVWRAGQ